MGRGVGDTPAEARCGEKGEPHMSTCLFGQRGGQGVANKIAGDGCERGVSAKG